MRRGGSEGGGSEDRRGGGGGEGVRRLGSILHVHYHIFLYHSVHSLVSNFAPT